MARQETKNTKVIWSKNRNKQNDRYLTKKNKKTENVLRYKW